MFQGKGQILRAQHFIKPIAKGWNIAARTELVSLLLNPPQVTGMFARLRVLHFSPFQPFPRAISVEVWSCRVPTALLLGGLPGVMVGCAWVR